MISRCADLDESGFLGQLLDGYAAVTQYPLFAVDEGDRAPARAGVGVAIVQGDETCVVAQGGDINRLFLFRAFDEGQIAPLSIQHEFCGRFHKLLSMGYEAQLYATSSPLATKNRAHGKAPVQAGAGRGTPCAPTGLWAQRRARSGAPCLLLPGPPAVSDRLPRRPESGEIAEKACNPGYG